MTVIGCVLNAPNWFQDAAEIMDKGFAGYEKITLLTKGEVVRNVPVEGGERAFLSLCAGGNLSAPMKKGTFPELILDVPEKLSAGIEKGQQIGTASLTENGQVIHSVPLYAADSVAEISFRFHLGRILHQWIFERTP